MSGFDTLSWWQVGLGLAAVTVVACFLIPWYFRGIKELAQLARTPTTYLMVIGFSLLAGLVAVYLMFFVFCIYSGIGGWWGAISVTVIFAFVGGSLLVTWLRRRFRQRSSDEH